MTQQFQPIALKIENALRSALGEERDVALIDFPNHSNVGDSAIWLGELDFLHRWRARIRFVCETSNYDKSRLSKCHPKGPILITGGGNFGDLWPRHHHLRETILQDFPGRKVVQCAQSIHFQSPNKLEQARQIVGAHKNFALLVRERQSYDLASRYFDCELLLCPDMALSINRKRIADIKVRTAVDTLYLSRSDKESNKGDSRPERPGLQVNDWLNESHPRGSKLYWFANRQKVSLVAPFALTEYLRLRASAAMAYARLERGCKLLLKGRNIVTDRLHAMILGIMLGLPVFAFDNSYGKLSAFLRTWQQYLPKVPFFENEQTAIEAAMEK